MTDYAAALARLIQEHREPDPSLTAIANGPSPEAWNLLRGQMEPAGEEREEVNR